MEGWLIPVEIVGNEALLYNLFAYLKCDFLGEEGGDVTIKSFYEAAEKGNIF